MGFGLLPWQAYCSVTSTLIVPVPDGSFLRPVDIGYLRGGFSMVRKKLG